MFGRKGYKGCLIASDSEFQNKYVRQRRKKDYLIRGQHGDPVDRAAASR